jgi:hypothetical protein
MRLIQLTATLLGLAALALPSLTRAADGASVHALLITASDQKAPADPRLAPYEAELQRNLPLSSFKYIGEGSAVVATGAQASITLAQGNHLEVESEKGAGLRLKVEWKNGDKILISTTLALQPGVPAVLGRRPSGDGDVPIVIVVAK